jgi:hypothetical protein
MNVQTEIDHLAARPDHRGAQPDVQRKTGRMGRVLKFLLAILSGPKGDQGGWEGGARGL